jgi:hypothetical protein
MNWYRQHSSDDKGSPNKNDIAIGVILIIVIALGVLYAVSALSVAEAGAESIGPVVHIPMVANSPNPWDGFTCGPHPIDRPIPCDDWPWSRGWSWDEAGIIIAEEGG